MDIILGIVLLLTLIVLVYFIYRGANLMVAFAIMTVVWAIIGGTKLLDIPNTMFAAGINAYASMIMTVIFGAWFGRIMVETGLVPAIIKKVVELGGNRPFVTCLLVCVVTAIIFTSNYGVGMAIAIGTIALPVMLGLGVPKLIAVSSYVMGMGAGTYVNMVNFEYFKSFVPEMNYQSHFKFGILLMVIQLILMAAMLAVGLRKGNVNRTWAAAAPAEAETKKVPLIAFITPIVPVLLVLFLSWDATVCMIIGVIVCMLLTGNLSPKRSGKMDLALSSLRNGINEIALLIGVMLSITTFARMTSSVSNYFGAIISPIIPASVMVLAIGIGILSPLGLFRGPLVIGGVGVATLSILLAMNAFPLAFVFYCIFIPTSAMGYSCCPTVSMVTWSLGYTKLDTKSYLKHQLPWMWAMNFIGMILAAILFK